MEWNLAEKSLLVKSFRPVFSKPCWPHFLILLVGCLLTVGNRTINNILRTLGFLADGHWTVFHKMLYLRRCRNWLLSRILIEAILKIYGSKKIYLAGDDTVCQHPGRRVFGKGKHRDAVRSSHSYLAFRWGHKWVVLAILLPVPWSQRLWALPVMILLYIPRELNQKLKNKHRTPPELMKIMLYKLVRWFPQFHFIFSGDGGFGSHELARFAYKKSNHITLISRMHPDANLYELPGARAKTGRPRKVGHKLLSPREVVGNTKKTRRTSVHWYGGKKRRVGLISGQGHWFKSGKFLVPIRWVYVKDWDGTHRDEYFYTTDPLLTPEKIVEGYTGRWSIETTFQEARAYMGVETTRGWSENTILRMEPMLFLLYSITTLLYFELPKKYKIMHIQWLGKSHLTFSDITVSVRRWLWNEIVFENPLFDMPVRKLRPKIRDTLLGALARAA